MNGHGVLNIYIPNDKWEPIELQIDSKHINYYTNEDIKTILTKEKFAQMQYNFEEE